MKIETGYIPSMDITVIFQVGEKMQMIIGWYFGEPDEENTKQYAGEGVVAWF